MSDTEGLSGTIRSNVKGPYTSQNRIPNIRKYKQEKKSRRANAANQSTPEDENEDFKEETSRAMDASGEGKQTGNSQKQETHELVGDEQDASDDSATSQETERDDSVAEDTSQIEGTAHDPKQQRKAMKKRKEERAEREVTDPVTHLPVSIHDFTGKDLKSTPHNEPPASAASRSATGLPAQFKDDEQLKSEIKDLKDAHYALQSLFPPPKFDVMRDQLVSITDKALIVVSSTVFLFGISLVAFAATRDKSLDSKALLFLVSIFSSACVAVFMSVRHWSQRQIEGAWESEVWEAERKEGKHFASSHASETTQWLNSLLASIWPLVNPDLFTSIADTLEDVMQASLPKAVRMVSVEDIGQGSEALRILGVKWLPTGAAAKSVSADGKLKSGSDEKKNDRTVPGQGEVENSADDANGKDDAESDAPQEEQNDENIAEGMEAESGDFVNLEIAFAYHARGRGKAMHSRAKNAHLYLAFYLYAGIKFPVWVEVHGIVGIIRLRMQLTPDPPFVSLCTLTFLGQPKIDVSCVPLSKRGLNIMDLPIISNFVQSAVDAGLSTLVAPRNMTLDLKEMLMGDDFKKDTTARGVLVVRVIRGFDFKEGDAGITLIKKGSADPYVSIGWAKFGKPVWSTRVLLNEMEPTWEETAFVLVGPEELNVEERIRVQLWDSDRTTADDDLGRIEVDLKQLMKDSRSNGKMWAREDGFKALKKGEGMPGRLCWEVGYFPKIRILDSQLAKQIDDPNIKTVEQLKERSYAESENKLREASNDESAEIEQQKQQDFQAKLDDLVIRSPPASDYPTGILSIQIHQITGLELEAINKNRAGKKDNASDEEEDGDDLPSSYCTIILNHQKIFRTRTKPKNGKPFFNAGTERVIRDWHNTDIHISVRDSRVHEDDPLLGMIYLPLGKLLAHRSQISEFFPLAGGVGFGRARVSIVFRSIQLQAPRELLGWEFGTLEIDPCIQASSALPTDLQGMRLKLRTSAGKAKAHTRGDGVWKSKDEKPLRIAVRKRYCSALVIEFRNDRSLKDSTAAFSVLWLKDVVDNDEQLLKLPVWKGSENLKRAEACCLKDCGEEVGQIELKITFWSGLSGYHNKLASKDDNLADVMEVLDAANDNDDMDLNFVDGSETSDTSSGDSDEGTPTSSTGSLSGDGKRGAIDSIKDFNSHRKQLHRKNRGLMQWKGARTVKWAEGKVKDGQRSIKHLFKHNERESGIETEV